MAELHIIGQILNAIGFEEPNIFCKWSIQFGKRKNKNNWNKKKINCFFLVIRFD